jgi:hypothetical protein
MRRNFIGRTEAFLENKIRGWLPTRGVTPSVPNKKKLEPHIPAIIYAVSFFLAAGLLSNLFDHEGIAYNLLQGLFIALVVGGTQELFMSRRRKRKTSVGRA